MSVLLYMQVVLQTTYSHVTPLLLHKLLSVHIDTPAAMYGAQTLVPQNNKCIYEGVAPLVDLSCSKTDV